MQRWCFLVALVVLAALMGDGCSCNRTEAACAQVLTGLCEFEERCGGGEAIGDCRANHPGFTCTVDVDEGAVCIDAINAALDADRIPGAVHLSRGKLEMNIEGVVKDLDAMILCYYCSNIPFKGVFD